MKKLLCAFALLFCLRVSAQAIGTGAYNFAPLESLGFDQINVGNLNVRFNIPLVSRQGRGLPFNYALQYEGLIWNAVTTNNVTTWQNDPDWGFHGQLNGTGLSGSLTYRTFRRTCPRPPHTSGPYISYATTYNNFVYHDAYGAAHTLNYSEMDPCPTDPDPDDPVIGGDGSARDGSGYTFVTDYGWQIKTRDGKLITPVIAQQSSYNNSITDANGNQITSSGGTFTDTLGVNALTIAGSGTPGNPRTFTYPVTRQADNATTKSAIVNYVNYVVTTNFQCSNIGEVGQDGTFQVNLVDSVQLASGDTYHFTYETTPGYSGRTTGRLASVTLPTGGTITYSYSGGCSSAGAGINSDGSVGALTRTTTDGVRSYNRAPLSSSATSTTVQDEKGNQTYYALSDDSINTQVLYKTHRQVYQGTIGNGVGLLDEYTCYNGANANCDGAAVTGAITQVTVTTSYNGGSQSTVASSYSNGQIIGQISNGLETTWSYNTLGEVLTTNTTYNGSLVASSSYNYDEGSVTATSGLPQHGSTSGTRGNLTSIHVTGSPNIDTSTTYYDTGMPATSTAADGGTTTYTYDGTGAFAQGIALPTPWSGVALATSASYDASSASLLSSTGMNSGETTSVNNYDALLRPIDITLPSGSHIWSDPNVATSVHSMVHQALDSGREALSETLLDSYGRVSRLGQYNGNSVNSWNQVDDCYDASGFLQFKSAAYQSTGEYGPNGPTPKHCSGAGTSYAYDALGRVVSVTTQDGTATTLYNNRAVKKTDVNGVSRITQYDLLGRISAVCESRMQHSIRSLPMLAAWIYRVQAS